MKEQKMMTNIDKIIKTRKLSVMAAILLLAAGCGKQGLEASGSGSSIPLSDRCIEITSGDVQMPELTRSSIYAGKLPTDRDFKMSGYFNSTDPEMSKNYFVGRNFTYDSNHKYWVAAESSLFWPLTGTLDLLAFVSEDESAIASWGENGTGDNCASAVEITGFDESRAFTDDLLAGCANGQVYRQSGVSIDFCHTKAFLIFTAKADEDDAVNITGIRINGVKTIVNATSKLVISNHNYVTAVWTGLSTTGNDVQVPGFDGGGYTVPKKAIDISGRMGYCGIGGQGILLPDQIRTSFTVFYTQKGVSGTQSFTYNCQADEPSDSRWEINRRYVYDLQFNTASVSSNVAVSEREE